MISSQYHPDVPLKRKMTPAQIELLRRVVATNGGGVSGYHETESTVKGLIQRHMVQGKAGAQDSIVHTREGLDWVRANPVAP